MSLDEWLKFYGGVSALADSLGVSKSAVYSWVAGVSHPSAKHLIAMHKLSKGRLDLESFCG